MKDFLDQEVVEGDYFVYALSTSRMGYQAVHKLIKFTDKSVHAHKIYAPTGSYADTNYLSLKEFSARAVKIEYKGKVK